MKGKEEEYSFSIYIYIILGFSCLFITNQNIIEGRILIVLGFLSLIIKDLLFGLLKPLLHKRRNIISISWKSIFRDFTSEKIHIKDLILVLNRYFLFPFLFILYIGGLIAYEMNSSTQYTNIIDILRSNFILSLVIISGTLTIFSEYVDDNYTITKNVSTLPNIIIGVILAFVSSYVLITQTEQLGWISYIISILFGILIFLLSLILIKQES